LGRDHAQAAALQLLAEGKAAMGLTAEEVQKGGGSDPRKVALAQVLQAKTTTVPQRWIAQQLKMGSAAHVSQQVLRFA
jgi:hypothetical protein